MGINQKELANILGVSVSTISRSFTNHPAIPAETRKRVLEEAEKRGYSHKQTRVQNVPSNIERPQRLGVFYEVPKSTIYPGPHITPGRIQIENILEECGSSDLVDFIYLRKNTTPENVLRKGLKSRPVRNRWKGLLLPYPCSDKYLEYFHGKLPLISLTEQPEYTECHTIDVDHEYGISELVSYAINCGHKNIGFYSQAYEIDAIWARRRFSSFVKVLAELDIPLNPEWCINQFSQEGSHSKSLDKVYNLTKSGEVTIWICASDHEAHQVIDRFKQSKFSNYSVCGFDGLPPEDDSLPTLTTYKVPHDMISRRAVQLANLLHEQPSMSICKVLVQGELIQGQTVQKI